MSRFDELLDRATSRLSADPELQLEIAHELRTHLEDSAAEYRAGGLGEDAAAAKAAEAFGDPEEVAQRLWAANRRRMRVRRITRVAAGATFGSAAAAMAVTLGWGAFTSLLVAIGLVTNLGWFNGTGWRPAFSRIAQNVSFDAYQQAIESLPPWRRVFFTTNSQNRFTAAQDLAQRWPSDPVYAANEAALAIERFHIGQRTDGQDDWSPHGLSETLAIIDRGQKLEPENGYYPLLRAAVLIEAGSDEAYDPDDPSLAFTYTDGRGQKQTDHLVTPRIVDRALFEQGLASLHEAAGKPRIDSHAAELAKRRMEALPAPASLADEAIRVQFARDLYLPFLNYYRDAVIRAGAFAAELARNGQPRRIESILADEMTVTRLVAAGAKLDEEVLIATEMRSEAVAQTVVIDRRLGKPDAAEAARRKFEADLQDWHRLMVKLWGPLETRKEHAGLLEAALLNNPRLVPDPQRSAASRESDYSVADQIALSALVALLVMAAIPLLPQFVRRLRGRPAMLFLFIGWRRLAWVVLIGAVLPLLMYGVYAYATPINARSYGIFYTHTRLPVQYLALAAVMAGLLRLMTNRASRKRALELGLAVPAPDRGWRVAQIIVSAIVALGTVAFLVAWRPPDPNADSSRLTAQGLGELLLVFVLGTYALASLLSAGSRPLFQQTQEPSSFLQKLSARFPGWPLYASLMAAATASLWLTWIALPAGTRGAATLVALSVTLSTTIALALAIVIQLVGRGRAGHSPTDSLTHATVTWRTAPLTFAAAAHLIAVIGFPFLQHAEARSVATFDRDLQFNRTLDHSPFAELKQRLASSNPGE